MAIHLGTNGDDTLIDTSTDAASSFNANWSLGADVMIGGTGTDIYYVNSSDDVVRELAGQGTDYVVSRTASYTLSDNLENLYLDDAVPTAFNGFGNALDNTIQGNRNANYLSGADGNDRLSGQSGNDVLAGGNGNDALDGGTGSDTMVGGAGYDTYVVDSAGDRVIGDNFDTVYSSVNYTLPGSVWKLGLQGSATSGWGNAAVNSMFGNSLSNMLDGEAGNDFINASAGDDWLNGGAGADELFGGTGADRFILADKGSSNADKLADFSHADDTMLLSNALDGSIANFALQGLAFNGGVLNEGYYFEGAGKNGLGFDRSGIYVDTSTNSVWYNPTSNVIGDSMLIAKLEPGTAATLDHSDFVYTVLL